MYINFQLSVEAGMGMRGIRVGMWEIGWGVRGIRMGMRGIKVGMWEIKLGMRGIRVILRENLRVYCFGQNPGARGEHFTIQLLWAAARLLATRLLPCLPNG